MLCNACAPQPREKKKATTPLLTKTDAAGVCRKRRDQSTKGGGGEKATPSFENAACRLQATVCLSANSRKTCAQPERELTQGAVGSSGQNSNCWRATTKGGGIQRHCKSDVSKTACRDDNPPLHVLASRLLQANCQVIRRFVRVVGRPAIDAGGSIVQVLLEVVVTFAIILGFAIHVV